MKPVIAITMGDCNGIGPEIALKCALSPAVRKISEPLLVGSLAVFESYARLLRIRIVLREVDMLPFIPDPSSVPVLNLGGFDSPRLRPGRISAEAGLFASEAIKLSTSLAMRRLAAAIVTAPVSKEALHLAGISYPGQTEMLAHLTHTTRAAMMLVGRQMKVGLVTIHTPLKNVAPQITRTSIRRSLSTIEHALRTDFAIGKPRIAVLGLNPHAGENGHLGTEERNIILPALRSVRRAGKDIAGPFPADAFFGTHSYRSYDAILAMYHDQGLIPLKMQNFEVGVNVTAGLPIVRTSPDHGTAFDIAGKGAADPTSMIEAAILAVQIAQNRKVHQHRPKHSPRKSK